MDQADFDKKAFNIGLSVAIYERMSLRLDLFSRNGCLVCAEVHHGLGRHIQTLTLIQVEESFKVYCPFLNRVGQSDVR